MEKAYGSKTDWKRLELLVGSYKELWKDSLVSIISNLSLNKPLSVLDLGSGSSYISASVLPEISCAKYTGIDVDKGALELASENLPGGIPRELILDSALSEKSLEASKDVDLVICLSNTFLCFSSRAELSLYLGRLRESTQARYLLISLVPWEGYQKSYALQFGSWFHLQNATDGCWVKMETSEGPMQVTQKIVIKDCVGETSKFEHVFCKLTVYEIASMFNESGWCIEDWFSPIDAKKVLNPAHAALPEFFVLCSKK